MKLGDEGRTRQRAAERSPRLLDLEDDLEGLAEQVLRLLAVDRQLVVIPPCVGQPVLDPELPAGRLGVGEDIELDARADRRVELGVVEGRGIETDAAAPGPVAVDALVERRRQALSVGVADDGLLVGDLVAAVVHVEVAVEPELHRLRRPVGPGVELVAVLVRLALEFAVPPHADAEDPVVPGIGGRGRPEVLFLGVADGDELGQRRVGDVGDEPLLEDVDEAAPELVLRVRRLRVESQRRVLALVAPQAHEGERVFVAAAARLLAGDDDLDVGALAVEDVVDEGDLGLDVLEVAGPLVAVEVDVRGDAPELVLRDGLGRAKGGSGREESEAGEEERGRNGSHFVLTKTWDQGITLTSEPRA